MTSAKELIFFPAVSAGRKVYAGKIRRFFAEYLAKNGLRLTRQRRRIVDALLAADRHLSQEELYKALRRFGLGRATIFRTLKMLQEGALVEPVFGKDSVPRFEVQRDRPHHDHLICIECGRIREVRWPKLEAIQEETCRKIGFIPKWHRHEIFGRCKECSR